MKSLLDALNSFGQNPEAVGDDLFSVFSAITHLSWNDAVAVGTAILALKKEAFNQASLRAAGTAASDPTVMRLVSCLEPVVQRLGQLIFEAPAEKREGLIALVTAGASPLVGLGTAEKWREAFLVPVGA